MAAEREIRVFISSPSDVGAERARAATVLRELSAEFAGRFRFAPVLWEESYYSAHRTFQEAIPKPSSCDLVVCILWRRLGTELPPEFNRPDGSSRTGTEYEFEEALDAALEHDVPDILVYRKRVLIDADRLGQEAAELRALNGFWQRWCNDEQGNFTASFDRFATEDEFHDKLKRQIRSWLGRLGHAVTWPVAALGSPFRGLAAFDAAHAPVFFGRRRAVRQAVAKLAAAAAGGCAFLLVLGGSGTGKSSLVRAGVIPFLTRDGARPEVTTWRVTIVRPATLGEDLLRGLAEALLQPGAIPELANAGAPDPPALAELMRIAPGEAAAAVGAALRQVADAAKLLLLVDQLEELLLRPAAECRALIVVLDALARGGCVWVIATLRNDRYGEFQTSPGLVRLKEDGDSFDLLPPGPAEIRDIIEGPARAAGLRFEEAGERRLAALLEAAAQERGALPLLQFTLQSLFIERDAASGTLLLSVYDRLGGLAGAVAGQAERLVADLGEASRSALAGLLLKLVEIQEGTDAATARSLDFSALTDPVEHDLASRLIEARLLTADGSGTEARLRLAHEALLTHWPRLADLVTAHRVFLAVRHRLDADAAAWLAEGRHRDFLLPSGRRLAEAADAVAQHRHELDAPSVAFVEASLAAERERLNAAAEARRRDLEQRAAAAEAQEHAARLLFRRTRAAVFAASILLLAAAGMASLWLDQREVARRRATEAEQNYATALKAASETLAIVQEGSQTGRVTAPVKGALLKITSEAFRKLPTENESPEATKVRAHLFISLASSSDPAALDDARRAVELARTLVARDAADEDTQSVLQEALWQLGSRMDANGDLASAANQLSAAEAVARRMADAHPHDQTWHDKLAADQRVAADVMRRRGDLAGALERYRASGNRVGEGDVLLARGDHVAAAAAYRDYLDAMNKRARQDGANANIARGLALAHDRIGDVLHVEGDLDGSLREYQASITVSLALMRNLLGNFDAARVQYDASRGAADVALARNDAAGALAQYQAIAATVAKRIQIAPRMAEWQAEQGEIDERIADAQSALGDLAAAEHQYRAALATEEGVLRMAPDDVAWQRDVELVHGRLGDVLRQKNDLDGAAAEYRTRIDLAGQLTKRDPSNADWQRDLALGWAALGVVLADRHDAGAATAFAHCLAVPVTTGADPRDERAHDPRDACRKAGAL